MRALPVMMALAWYVGCLVMIWLWQLGASVDVVEHDLEDDDDTTRDD